MTKQKHPERKSRKLVKSLSKAIVAHCYECSGNNKAEAARCENDECALHPYRGGG